MKYRIVEIDKSEEDKNNFCTDATPLTYRVSISLENNEIILQREFFYVGYNSGEQIDDFYINDITHVIRMTYLTRNFDKKHLEEKEKMLIKKFYYELINTEKELKKELKESVKYFNKKIKRYQKYQECDLFTKIKRKEKLNIIDK